MKKTKSKTVLKDLRAREAALAAELADVRKQIKAEEARQASVQGNGLGEMMRKLYAERHPDANLDDLTPEQIFQLVLDDQAKEVAKAQTEQAEAEPTKAETTDQEPADADGEIPEADRTLEAEDASENESEPEQQMFRF